MSMLTAPSPPIVEVPLLFRVVGTETYLYGSIHALPNSDPHLPAELWPLIDRAERCIFEIDYARIQPASFAKFGPDDSLARHISPTLFSNASSLWSSLGIQEDLSRMKVWSAGLTLGMTLVARQGVNFGLGVDRQLFDKAVLNLIPITALEDISALRIFDEAPFDEQIAGLTHVITQPERCVEEFYSMHRAWRMGDLAALSEVAADRLKRLPVTFKRLLGGRNRKWLSAILECIRSGEPTFIAVGALHLVGDDSLPALLRKHGYEIPPIL
jgi:uncharacterized protein YbaP (TraB family)